MHLSKKWNQLLSKKTMIFNKQKYTSFQTAPGLTLQHVQVKYQTVIWNGSLCILDLSLNVNNFTNILRCHQEVHSVMDTWTSYSNLYATYSINTRQNLGNIWTTMYELQSYISTYFILVLSKITSKIICYFKNNVLYRKSSL